MVRRRLSLVLTIIAALSAVPTIQSQGSTAAAPALGPGPYSEAEQRTQRCIDLIIVASESCQTETDVMGLIFPRQSEQLPTGDQIFECILKLRQAALPSDSCCTDLKPFVDLNCHCDLGFRHILPISGTDPAYIEGTANILALACRFDFRGCGPGLPPVDEPDG